MSRRESIRKAADGFRAQLLRRRLVFGASIARWLQHNAAERVAHGRRWLRRWRVVARAHGRRAELSDELSQRHQQRARARVLARLRAAHRRRDASLTACVAVERRTWVGALRLWRRVAVTRAAVRRSLATRAALRMLLHQAWLRAVALLGPAKLAFARLRRRLTAASAFRERMRGMLTLRRRCVDAAAQRKLTRTRAFAARWHFSNSARQHALARLLLNGWVRQQRKEQSDAARVRGAVRRLVEACHLWRRNAIGEGQRRATRHAVRRATLGIRSSVVHEDVLRAALAPAHEPLGRAVDGGDDVDDGDGTDEADGEAPPCEGGAATSARGDDAAAGGDGDAGGDGAAAVDGAGAGEGAARMLLGWAAEAIASPAAPMRHQRPAAAASGRSSSLATARTGRRVPAAPCATPMPATEDVDDAAALLDQLVHRRQAPAPRAAQPAAAAARSGPPSAPLSRGRPFAARRACIERHNAKAVGAAPVAAASTVVGAALDGPTQPAAGRAQRMDAAMAELHQRLALDVPLPSYLSMPAVVRAPPPGATEAGASATAADRATATTQGGSTSVRDSVRAGLLEHMLAAPPP